MDIACSLWLKAIDQRFPKHFSLFIMAKETVMVSFFYKIPESVNHAKIQRRKNDGRDSEGIQSVTNGLADLGQALLTEILDSGDD